MIDKIKEYSMLVVALLLIAIFSMQLNKCSADREAKADLKKLDQNISALNDSIKKKVNDKGDTVFTENTVEMSLDELVKTNFFKQMSKEKQQYYLDLQKTNRLLAASYEVIRKQDSLLVSLQYNSGTQSDTGVCFNYGDTLNIPKDTINKFIYDGSLVFKKDRPLFKLNYQSQVRLDSKFLRNKDGSITIEHTLDDPNAKIIDGQSYIVPAPKKTKLQKILGCLKIGLPVAGAGFIGYKIGQATK